jgi:hypothetical protein
MPKAIKRRRNAYFIGSILLVVFLFSYYFFAYIPEREREMDERGIRVMNRMVKNLNERVDHYDRSIDMFKCDFIVQNIIENYRKNGDDDGYAIIEEIFLATDCDDTQDQIYRYAAELSESNLDWDEFYTAILKYIEKDIKRDQRVELVDSSLFSDYPYVYDLKGYGGLVISAENLIKDTERFEFFEDVIVSIPSSKKVFDESRLGLEYFDFKPNLPAENDAKDQLNDIAFDEEGGYYKIPSVEIVPRKIGGENYLSFTRLFWIQDNPYYLTGLIGLENYQGQSRYVSIWVVMISVVFLLFLIQVLPIIKPFILSKSERLHIVDVMWSALALVFGVAALGLFVVGIDTFAIEEVDLVDEKLIRYAKEIKKEFNNEVAESVSDIRNIERALKLTKRINELPTKKAELELEIANLNLNKKNNTNYKHSINDLIAQKKQQLEMWPKNKEALISELADIKKKINNDVKLGARFLKIDQAGQADYYRVQDTNVIKIQDEKLNLSHRQYYLAYQNNASWSYQHIDSLGTESYFVESIFSLSSGLYETVVAIPDESNSTPIWAEVSQFKSVNNMLLETNYSYCIIDEKGNIHYHSDQTKINNENYIAESDNNDKLISYLRNKSSKALDNTFALTDFRIHISPIEATPWYIITQYDIKKSRLTVTSSMTQTFILVLSVMLYLLVLHFCYRLIITRSLKGSSGFVYLFLNPLLVNKKVHIWLSAANAFVLVLLGVLYKVNQTNILLNFLMYLAAATVIITLTFTVLTKTNPIRSEVDSFMLSRWKYVEWVLAALSLIWIGAAWFIGMENDFITLICILLLVFVVGTLVLGQILSVDRGKRDKDTPPKYFWFYINTTTWILLLSLVPGLLFFKSIYNEQHIKRATSHLIQAYQDTRLLKGKKQLEINLFDVADSTFNELEMMPASVMFSEFVTPFFSGEGKTLQGQFNSEGITTQLWHSESKTSVTFCNGQQASYPCFKIQLQSINDFVNPNNLPISTSIVGFSLPHIANSKGRLGAIVFWVLFAVGLLCLFGIVAMLSQRFFYLNLLRRLRALVGIDEKKTSPIYPNDEWVREELKAIKKAVDLSKYQDEILRFKNKLENDKNAGLRLEDREQIVVEEIAQLAKADYDTIWTGLDEEEKLLLFDLAQDGLVNAKNEVVIFNLTKKGLIKPYPVLSPINMSFDFYINYLIASNEAVKLEVAAKKDGVWNTYKYLVIFLIVVIVIFLSLAEKEAIARITGIISITAAVFPGIIRTLSTIGSSSKFFNKP